MDTKQILSSMASGTLTSEQKAHVESALMTHDQVLQISQAASAIDWKTILAGLFQLLPSLFGLIPGLGALGTIFNLIAALFKLPIPPIPVPTPTPIPGGGGIPVTPFKFP